MREMMIAADPILRPGIEAMPGLLAYYGGARPIMNYATLWQLNPSGKN